MASTSQAGDDSTESVTPDQAASGLLRTYDVDEGTLRKAMLKLKRAMGRDTSRGQHRELREAIDIFKGLFGE